MKQNHVSLYRSNMCGNNFRFISIIYCLTKQTCDFFLVGIISNSTLAHLIQYVFDIPAIPDICINRRIINIFQGTFSRKKHNIENGQTCYLYGLLTQRRM